MAQRDLTVNEVIKAIEVAIPEHLDIKIASILWEHKTYKIEDCKEIYVFMPNNADIHNFATKDKTFRDAVKSVLKQYKERKNENSPQTHNTQKSEAN